MSCCRTRNRRRSEGAFTLVEVIIALAIIALVAVVLLDQRLEIVREAGRSRDLKTAWTLAADKMAELEMDKTLWTGAGAQVSGDFGQKDPASAGYTWDYTIARETVAVGEPGEAEEKPRELLRLTLQVAGPALEEPIRVEGLFPIQEVKPQ